MEASKSSSNKPVALRQLVSGNNSRAISAMGIYKDNNVKIGPAGSVVSDACRKLRMSQ